MTIETPRSWDWKPKLRWFAAEFLVVVTGVMVALALNAWIQGRQNERSEAVYLSLLSRDLEQTIASLEVDTTFQGKQVRDGFAAYHALSGPVVPADRRAVTANLTRLMTRRTVILNDPTYQDLIATGNLRLITNREVRDRIVDFFEGTRLQFDIINRNNSFYVDETYNRSVQRLVLPRPGTSNLPVTHQADSVMMAELSSGYTQETDRLWTLSANSPELAELKAMLVSRIRIALLAKRSATNLLKDAQQLKALLDAQ
jgi:hypothetical protein